MKEVRTGVEAVRPGRNLFVREWILGVDEGEPMTGKRVDLQIMIVHGSCATERQFHLLLLSLEAKVQALPRKCAVRCLLCDAVGCGSSPIPTEYEAYSPENMMQDIKGTVETFLDQKVPLLWMGHSYGPSLILRLLVSGALANYKSAGLILIGTAVRPEPNDPNFFPDGGLLIFRLPVWMIQCLQHFMTVQFTKIAIHPKHVWLRNACLADSNANSCFMIRSFYRQTVWATTDDLLQVVAAHASLPVLVIHGVNDGVIQIKYGQDLANAVPDATFCPVEEASHLVMMEQADKVATMVLDFLKQHFLK
eukprot:scaffold13276_cov151-Amphora_coffeaeformis.AAC.2